MSLDCFVYTISDCRGRLLTLETEDIGAPLVVRSPLPHARKSWGSHQGEQEVSRKFVKFLRWKLINWIFTWQQWSGYGNAKYPGRFIAVDGEPAEGKLIVSRATPVPWMLRPVPEQDRF